MAPNVATYNTIGRSVDETPERKPEVSRKLSAAVAVCACVLFFAGRTAHPSEFSHQQVLDVAEFCGAGEFIGGCNSCKECADFEFANGGCSYFKDTFCSFCEPIKNCPREQISCTDVTDSYCNLCDCNDPVRTWDDVVIEYANDHQLEGAETFSCYISDGSAEEGGECAACHVCAEGEFEVTPCNPETNEDTVCRECTQCEVGEWVQIACTYATDTVCQACDWCADDSGNDRGLFTFSVCDAGTVLVAGANAVCRECAVCDDGDWVSSMCAAGDQVTGDSGLGSDTQCSTCTLCEGPTDEEEWDSTQWSEFIEGQDGVCVKGARHLGEVNDCVCRGGDEYGGECSDVDHDTEWCYLVDSYGTHCSDTSAGGGGSWSELACQAEGTAPLADGHDTVCADCTMPEDVNGCDDSGLGCSNWASMPCKPTGISDAIYKDCDSCSAYEYNDRNCQFIVDAPHHNAICAPCSEISVEHPLFDGEMLDGVIAGCPMENHRCAADGSSYRAVMGVDDATQRAADTTGEYDMAEINHRTVVSHCAIETEEPVKGCENGECNVLGCVPGRYGPQCQYLHITAGCGKEHISERSAKKGRKWFDDSELDVDITYPKGDRTHDFVAWCMVQCEENPLCRGFEIEDGGADFTQTDLWTNYEVGSKSMCRFYTDIVITAEIQQVGGFKPKPQFDCFVNLPRVDPEEVLPQIEQVSCDSKADVEDPNIDCYEPEVPNCVWGSEDERQACKAGGDHWCDAIAGLTWCKEKSRCIDATVEPCIPKKKMKHTCPEGLTYCFCTSSCLKKGNPDDVSDPGDVCQEFSSGQQEGVVMAGEIYCEEPVDPVTGVCGGKVKSRRFSKDCWAIDNENFHNIRDNNGIMLDEFGEAMNIARRV